MNFLMLLYSVSMFEIDFDTLYMINILWNIVIIIVNLGF